jgi:hypothetical protein
MAMIEGINFILGGEEITVPPLNFKKMKELQKDIEGLSALKDKKTFNEKDIMVICKIVHSAIERNYPQVKLEWVEENLDMGNAAGIIHEILTGSGVKEKRAAGEAKTLNP